MPVGATLGEGGEFRAWSHNAQTWIEFSLPGPWPETETTMPPGLDGVQEYYDDDRDWERPARKGYGKGGGWWNSEWNKKKDGDIPEWDGKTSNRQTYFRKIDIWESTTGVQKG